MAFSDFFKAFQDFFKNFEAFQGLSKASYKGFTRLSKDTKLLLNSSQTQTPQKPSPVNKILICLEFKMLSQKND